MGDYYPSEDRMRGQGRPLCMRRSEALQKLSERDTAAGNRVQQSAVHRVSEEHTAYPFALGRKILMASNTGNNTTSFALIEVVKCVKAVTWVADPNKATQFENYIDAFSGIVGLAKLADRPYPVPTFPQHSSLVP
jgi:hypothetical protein